MGTPIDLSSFYLRKEFFFSSELTRHAETTLHHGVSPLTDAKNVKKSLDQNILFEPTDSL